MFGFTKTSPRLKRLESISLFRGLTRRELNIIEMMLHERYYLAGEVIFDAGEEGQGIYIVLQGRVGVFNPDASAHALGEHEAGSFFGELALLDDDIHRTSQARAMEDSSVVVMFRGEFLQLLETHAVIASKISLQLARHLGHRLRNAALAQGRREVL